MPSTRGGAYEVPLGYGFSADRLPSFSRLQFARHMASGKWPSDKAKHDWVRFRYGRDAGAFREFGISNPFSQLPSSMSLLLQSLISALFETQEITYSGCSDDSMRQNSDQNRERLLHDYAAQLYSNEHTDQYWRYVYEVLDYSEFGNDGEMWGYLNKRTASYSLIQANFFLPSH